MDFYDVLDQVVELLQRRGRVTYNALKLQFYLDDDQLAVLKDELLYAYPQVIDDAGRGLRWTDEPAATQAPALPALHQAPPPVSQADHPPQDASRPATSPQPPTRPITPPRAPRGLHAQRSNQNGASRLSVGVRLSLV